MASASGFLFKCFVRGLDCDTDEKDLKEAFSKFGNIIDTKIIYDHETGRSRRFGFVTFKDEKSMRDAIKEMNSHGPTSSGFQCFVHGLSCDTDAKSLAKLFAMFGKVLDSEIIYDRETGISRGFGYVTFKDKKSMDDAIDAVLFIDGDGIDGYYINVEAARSSHGVRRRYGSLRFSSVTEARPRELTSAEFALSFSAAIKAKERSLNLQSNS